MALFPAVFDDPFDDAVSSFFGERRPWQQRRSSATSLVMSTDIRDTGSAYEMTIELPGFDKSDVHVQLKDGYLIVSATKVRSAEDSASEGSYVHRERFAGSRSRSFYVGNDLKSSDIKASFANGVLTLIIPKQVETPKQEDQTVEIED
ncbi:MAG: Hsp20/alpha crystallin family protein [Bifidobacteriaceae bacterium]|nr:Hsp20/alpha crystallin family protein [Aeriscardovia sp.]MEE1324678.1 Hsp20/alpha crystallin family protein [Bifidobacteriaceae bacterium]